MMCSALYESFYNSDVLERLTQWVGRHTGMRPEPPTERHVLLSGNNSAVQPLPRSKQTAAHVDCLVTLRASIHDTGPLSAELSPCVPFLAGMYYPQVFSFLSSLRE